MTGSPVRSGRGFTLIEVLVALAIVAITLGAGIKAAGALSNNAERLAEVSQAEWCADNQLTALRLSSQTLNVGDTDFACDQLGRSFRGQLQIRPTPNPYFRRVESVIRNGADQTVVKLSAVLPRSAQ